MCIRDRKSFDAGEEEKKGILGFFKKKGDQLDAMKMKYNKAETNVETVSYTHLDVYKRQAV